MTVAAGATVAGIATAALSRLYLARVCSVRTVEVGLLARVSIVSAVVAAIVGPSLGDRSSIVFFVPSMVWVFALLNVERGMFAYWVRSSRAQGLYARPVVIIGTNDEGRELYHLLTTEPELGYQVVGVVGDPLDGAIDWPVPWLGDGATRARGASSQRHHRLRHGGECFHHGRADADCSTICWTTTSMSSSRAASRASPITDCARCRSAGRRRSISNATTPLDCRGSSSGRSTCRIVILCAPFTLVVVGVAAIAIKLDSRGSIIYRQTRIGRGGRPFTMYKLRTMVAAADQQLDVLAAANQRTDGPLFKLEQDPRVTRVGRLLRATSIDELPQLWCVLIGTMSLVGPRPPLADEVAHFDRELRTRFDVTPGITGLWQVEARDNPSFHVYRRYDLFYVENWSVRLDFAILIRTFESVVTRAVRRTTARPGRRSIRSTSWRLRPARYKGAGSNPSDRFSSSSSPGWRAQPQLAATSRPTSARPL